MAALFAVAGLSSSVFASTVKNGGSDATNSNFGVITIQANGSFSVTQNPTAGAGTTHAFPTTYDANEDVVYNVINKSNVAFTSFTVLGTGIAGFDGDGIDNYVDATGTLLSGKTYGVVQQGTVFTDGRDYAGFANGSAANSYLINNLNSVTVTFGGGGIAASAGGVDGSAFISFEADGLTNGQVSFAPLPPAVWSGLALVLGIGAYTKFAKTKIA